jgi:DDE superfamily endonuclease
MNGEVLYLSETYGGCVHDKKICDRENLSFSKKVFLLGDLGFLGISSENASIILPFKQKKKQELDEIKKAHNKWQASVRVRIEHTIARIKIFRKMKETFRGRLFNREDTVMLVACALHNLKLKVKFT